MFIRSYSEPAQTAAERKGLIRARGKKIRQGQQNKTVRPPPPLSSSLGFNPPLEYTEFNWDVRQFLLETTKLPESTSHSSCVILCNISKTSASVSPGFQTREN